MGWWFLGCFSHRKSSKKKHNRRRRHPPNNDKTEQGFSVVAVQTAAAATTVKKKQEEQQVAEPDAHAAIPVFLEPTDNEAVVDSVPHLPAAPQPNVAAVIIKTETIEASSTGIQVNLTNERQGLDAEREESPIHCNDDALEEKPHSSEREPREEADKILGAHGSSSNSVEATHTSSLGTHLSGSSCGYYEISGSCLLRTDIDDDGCEPSTSLTSRSNNDSKAATSSFSSGTDGTLVSSQISDDSSCKEVLLVSSLQGGSEVSSSSSSAHDECTADSQESRCSIRPSGHRYQGFEEEESDTDPDYDENEQGGGGSIIAYTCLDRFDEEDEDAFSDAVSTAAFASNIREEEEELDISSSLVQSSSPPAPMRKQRSVLASPVLTPVENLLQWKRVKQSERWKSAALEHLRHRASLLELQARITEEEEQQQQENQKPKHGHGSIPDTAMATKKAANARMAPDVVSLSHWIKP